MVSPSVSNHSPDHQAPWPESSRYLSDAEAPTTKPTGGAHRIEGRALSPARAAQARSRLTLIVEAIDAVDAGTLMVPTEQEEVLRVLDLIGQQQTDGLQRLLASVHIVPQKEVVAFRREAAILEQPQKVIVLAMDVTCDPGNQVSTRFRV